MRLMMGQKVTKLTVHCMIPSRQNNTRMPLPGLPSQMIPKTLVKLLMKLATLQKVSLHDTIETEQHEDALARLATSNDTEDAGEIVDEVGNAAKSDDVDCSLHDTIETEQHEDALARLAISNDTEDAAEIVDEVGNAAKSDDVDCSLHHTIEIEQHEDALAPLAISNDTEDITEITDEIANAETSDDNIGVSFHGNFDTEQNDNHRLNLVIV